MEKVATLIWRYRRLLKAETAEVQKTAATSEWDKFEQSRAEAMKIGIRNRIDDAAAFIVNLGGAVIRNRYISLLDEMHEAIIDCGFDNERDGEILKAIYGMRANEFAGLRGCYERISYVLSLPEQERQQRDLPTVEECKKLILGAIAEERERLKKYGEVLESVDTERRRLDGIPGDQSTQFPQYKIIGNLYYVGTGEPGVLPRGHAEGRHPDQQHVRAQRANHREIGRTVGIQIF